MILFLSSSIYQCLYNFCKHRSKKWHVEAPQQYWIIIFLCAYYVGLLFLSFSQYELTFTPSDTGPIGFTHILCLVCINVPFDFNSNFNLSSPQPLYITSLFPSTGFVWPPSNIWIHFPPWNCNAPGPWLLLFKMPANTNLFLVQHEHVNQNCLANTLKRQIL